MIEDRNFINSRIECEGFFGTVKYIGPVGNTKGQWLGIDWDDQSRGKHNGTYEGVHYFNTWHPTSGSFIRPQKAKFGISCPEAIKRRYGLINEELDDIDKATIASVQKSFNAPFIEMVGFSKVSQRQSKFDELKIVCLQDQCVSDAGEPCELATLCPKVEELDISRNLINSWKIVADICCQLKYLYLLNASENSLPVNNEITLHMDCFKNVRHLTLAKMKYDWLQVTECLKIFPSVEQLFISVNHIISISIPEKDSYLINLIEISLEDNLIDSWDEVLKLGCLPRLKNLNLNSNRITKIRFPTKTPVEKTLYFACLKQLHLSNNKISDWKSVSELEKLEELEDLKFRENPLLIGENLMTLRQYVIARISKLKYLNGAEITLSERRGAEYDYIKLHSSAWIKSNNNPQEKFEFIENHPRFPELTEKYGVMEVIETKKNTDLQSNVINVEFICPDHPKYSHGVKKKIMKNMEVQKLLGIISHEDEILLDKPLQDVSYYFIEDGDKILVRW